MRGDIDERLIETDAWTDEMVGAAGIPVIDVPLVTVGGGIGSFTLFDTLRIYGVPRRAMAVLSPQDVPWQSYEHLTRVSQIPRTERLRSDSGGMPENIWGFPSYAVRDAIADKSLHPLWNVLTEPVCADYYTILTPPAGVTRTKRIAFRSTYVHIAIGYPGLRLLPDLQAYREKYRDPTRVVNAYEPHEHVYQALQRRPGTVMVRGSGIVASRVLQRLIDDRDRLGLHTQILHLFRTYVAGPHGSSAFMRRKGGDGWAYQGFNWPKATWGGQLKTRLRKLEGRERAALLKTMGGTNTPVRKIWQRQLARGRAEGWHQILAGEARDLRPDRTRPGVVTTIDPDQYAPLPFRPPDRPFDTHADYIIDCTGLEADIREHRLLADLLAHAGAPQSAGAILAAVVIAGIGWEFLYHFLQQFRWEKDWPTLFGLVTIVNEGLLMGLLVYRTTVVVPRDLRPSALAFTIDFVLTWLAFWLFVNGPIRVLLPRWRFNGGRVV